MSICDWNVHQGYVGESVWEVCGTVGAARECI